MSGAFLAPSAGQETPDPPIVVTVDGQVPEEGRPPRIPECAVTIGAANLPAGEHEMAATLGAEHGAVTVFEISEPGVVGTWSSGPHDLTDAVAEAELTPQANGYHLQLTVTMDGAAVGGGPFWLGCGADQHEGHGWWVTFDAAWFDWRGSATDPPRSTGEFRIEATSPRGSATCVYDAETGELTCTYERSSCEDEGEEHDDGSCGGGHEDGGGEHEATTLTKADEEAPAGLHVPGRGSFTVSVTGVPRGWEPDAATLGTFAVRDVCTEPEGSTGLPVCEWTVGLRHELVVVVPTDPTPPDDEALPPEPGPAPVPAPEPAPEPEPVAPPPASTDVLAAPPAAAPTARPAALARTGPAAALVLLAGLGALTAGAGAMVLRLASTRRA